MSNQLPDFSGFMIATLLLFFLMISYCMGVMVHSALMYEDKNNIEKNSLMKKHNFLDFLFMLNIFSDVQISDFL